MALPEAVTEGTWPPKPYQGAYARYGDWDAWLRGDPDYLRYRFAGRGATGTNDRVRVRASQYMGGVVGRFSRWLWGAPPSDNQTDGRLHAPLAADIARTRANLLFGEPPKLSGPVDDPDDETAEPDKEVTAWLERFYQDGFPSLLLTAAEAASALGDVYLRPVVDEEVLPGRSFPAVVHADGAFPVIRWGRLSAVTFWTCLYADGREHLRLLEHHGVDDGDGYIEYGVYSGTPDQLGQQVDLKALKSYPGYAGLVTDELIETRGVHPTGLDRLDVVRVANAGLQRTFRNDAVLKYLGASVFDGCEQFFDRYDEVWTSWMRDIRLAKGRIILPDYMLQSNGPGGGASFDAEREVWMALSDLPKPTGGTTPIVAQQFEIRAEAHKATLDEIRASALQHAGVSQQTLGQDDGATAMTATEAQARERLSFTTRDTEIVPWTVGIADCVELQMLTDRAHGFADAPDPVRPSVEFGDGVAESPKEIAETVQLLMAAEAISDQTAVQMVHPDWSRKRVEAEVIRIQDKRKAAQPPAPDGDFGGGGDGPPGE